MKGISPMIAVVLLIAFTVAVGGIVSVWLSGLTTTTTTTTGTAGEKQVLCAGSVLTVDDVTANMGTTDFVNITVKYDYGTQNLYYFNITLVDNLKNSATVTPKIPAKNYNKTNPLTPGSMNVWNLNLSSTSDLEAATTALTGTSLSSVRVSAKCQDDYPISAECKSGQACMK